ncbi:protein PLASTID REDOX INSENSITIVE 2, chloroplastic isoform X2 [Cajanus cajan]|uniref:protein PLASTID REDOX INSENSITIVE 2, chloroplastic isoform X2 n=1 Tax=Cajanus cajan TaxID=3821 RepID=UPI00098DBF2C|nr:protein PLASTID REDOX INSENSITIVE 2, chloroplastic isoform X2 [Cajanus cajan]
MMVLASSPVTVTLSAAKTLASNALIPHHSFPPSPSPSPSWLSLKPICRISFTCALSHNHVYPNPIPEFAKSETRKFQTQLFRKLSENVDEFGDDLDQIFSEFLHKDYGGPGTLLVEPFTDMMVALKKKKLPGAALAARASLLWAQNYVDKDWEVWNSKLK